MPGPPRAACRRRAPWLREPPHFATPAKSCIFLMMNGGPSHVDTFDYKPELAKYAGQTLPADKKFTNSGNRKMGFLTPAWRPFRPGGRERPDDLGLLPARARACRQVGPAALVPYRQPRARLGAGGDEHGQDVHRPSVAGQLGGVWPGDRESELARLCGDSRQARRPDQRSAELGERLHAQHLSRDALPSGGRSGARSARAGLYRRGNAARAARPAGQTERAAHARARPAAANWHRALPATNWRTACNPRCPRRWT